MLYVEKIDELKAVLAKKRTEVVSIGFVPTMGALHKGHISLIDKAKEENDLVVCSVFVNPTQFNKKDDLEKYPRDVKKDAEMLTKSSCDLLFLPLESEMYPKGVDERIALNLGQLGDILEGKFRPGHFDGVATIVYKLFEAVLPDRAYFGEKDLQQLMVIQQMVRSYNLPVQIISCPIIRELDGLAMSSRNQLLSKEQREKAPFLFKILRKAKDFSKKITVNEVKKMVTDGINSNPAFSLEYFEILDSRTFSPILSWKESEFPVACIAAYMDNVRLIDNIKLFS